MRKRIGPGHPCEDDEPRKVFRRVRLSEAEAKALDEMQINFTELVRAIAQAHIKTKIKYPDKHLPKAS